MKNKGFTLVELLAVIIILGILLGLGISAYSKYLVMGEKKSYNIAEESFKSSAMDAIADCLTGEGEKRTFCQNHSLPEDQFTYEIIHLEELIADDYIEAIRDPSDTDQLCDTNSYVYISNKNDLEINNNADLTYKVCLICGDYKSKDCLEDIDATTTYQASCKVTYDEEGTQPYQGEWTNKDLYLTFTASGDYKYSINNYRYQIGSAGEKKIAAVDDKAVVQLSQNVNNQVIKVTAVDGMGQTSTTTCGSGIKIDKLSMTSATLSGKLSDKKTSIKSGNWASTDVILTVTTDPEELPSGYYYQWYKDGVKLGSQTTSNTYTATSNGTYSAVVTNGLQSQSITTNSFVVKIDKTKPVISPIANPIVVPSRDYNFVNNVVYQFGPSGGTVTCNPVTSTKLGTYKVVCIAAGNNKLSTSTSFTTKVDITPPTITVKVNPYITTSQSYNYVNNVTATFGISSGSVSCSPASSSQLGIYTVTCTAVGNNKLSASASFEARVDPTVPVISPKVNPIVVDNTTYDFKNNITYTFGVTGGTVVCSPATSSIKGIYDVTCIATGNNGLVATTSFSTKVDTTTPTIVAKENPLTLGTDAYDFKNNVTATFGVSGGTVTCNPANSKGNGTYNVTCTALGNNNKSASVTFNVNHNYAATCGSHTYTCTNPHNCEERDNGYIVCDYDCDDGMTRQQTLRYPCESCPSGWGGVGDTWSDTDNNYCTCPSGGTLQGEICVFQ